MKSKRNLTPKFRNQLKEVYGTKCRICGAENVEYHHIIPLSWGGTDDINNFLPLCYEHHMMMHGVRARKSFVKGEYSRVGRPRKIPKNYKDILGLYINCKIGRQECQNMLGMGRASKLFDTAWYKEYLEEQGIEECRNLVDVVAKNGVLVEGKLCGYIKRKGKKIENCFWSGSFFEQSVAE